MKKVEPIRPDKVDVLRAELYPIPDGVIEVINNLIAQAWNGSGVVLMQEKVITSIMGTLGVERNAIFEGRWLDFESVYRKAGWKVEYDPYDANWTFRK